MGLSPVQFSITFAAIRADGSVVTWGSRTGGGDSRNVQHQLCHVKQIQASLFAFAAIRADGSVVAWGDPACGGDSRVVQHQLFDVRHIQASLDILGFRNPQGFEGAFAAIRGDGSVGQRRLWRRLQ